MPTSCGINVSYYELTYYSLVNPGIKYMDRALRLTIMSTIVNHTVFLLTPHTTYTLQVRVFGYLDFGTDVTTAANGVTHPFISAYSSSVTFQTQEAGMYLYFTVMMITFFFFYLLQLQVLLPLLSLLFCNLLLNSVGVQYPGSSPMALLLTIPSAAEEEGT